ncbi:aromatic-ring hydroxylase C-terminal domain-containing protein [Paenibacillus chitinolyticus]
MDVTLIGSCSPRHAWEDYRNLQVVSASLDVTGDDWNDVHSALIRPDGHIAWAIPRSYPNPGQTIKEGIARWCGNVTE